MQQVIDFLDALGLQQVDVVGNSFGGALALALTVCHPERIRKLVLMGAVGVSFDVHYGLDRVWGYTPSIENMRAMLDTFAYNRELVNEDLAQLRYQASIRPGFQESFSAMFPAPRQRWVEELARYQGEYQYIQQPTLIIHGREDRVIPLEASLKIFSQIRDAQLHVFGRCGHWTQIEHTHRFVQLVENFLAE
jgi:2-hydroxymuconate-semialdehyde hydrolase